MDNSFYYDTGAINFIKILFRIFLGFIIIVFILIFTLELNDTVKFKEGQIYSDTPQLKIIAPNEAKVIKTLVKEGQEVKQGDTLFILENKREKTDFEVINMSIKMLTNKTQIINQLINSSKERKNSLEQLLQIQSKIYNTDRKKADQEIIALNNQIKLSTRQASILKDQFKTDSLLYVKGAISKLELTQTKSRTIDGNRGQIDINSNYKMKNYDFENLSNNFEKTNNDLRRNIIEIDNQIQNYEKDLVEIESSIEDKKSNLIYMADELNKLMIISPIEGTISNLFNVKQNLQMINKGDLITIIAPKKEKFYAKIILDEKSLAYVKNGQEINLKLDAYNYYRFGAIKGNITYVSSSDVDRTFYCIAQMKKYNKNIHLKAGYVLKGEIIVEKMRLFQYIIKKLFNKIDDSIN
jgi:multidrug resistance efflux pump